MSDLKRVKLYEVAQAHKDLREATAAVEAAREVFIDKIVDAKRERATQQEIADEIGLSRQRVAQFLDERKRHV